jgi:cytoskeleton protein RodZ
METFGQYLKSEREKLDITVDEIAEITRIGRQIIRDLESDDYENMPHDTFVRGFLRSIARELHIDQAELVLKYKNYRDGLLAVEAAQTPDKMGGWRKKRQAPVDNATSCDDTPDDEATASTTSTATSNKLSPDYSKLIIPTLIVVAIISLIAFLTNSSPTGDEEQIYLNDIGHIPAADTISDAPAAPVIGPATTTDVTPLVPEQPLAEPSAEPPVVSSPETETPTTGSVTRGNLLIKSVRGTSWVGYTVDGGTMSDVTLPQGQTIELEGINLFRLQIGNAAAVRVMLNGRDLGILGREGEVRVLELNAQDGLRNNRTSTGG